MSSPPSEFRRAWTVILAAAAGVGLGITGLPIYTTGQFIRPLEQAFGWSRSITAGGLIFLTIGSVLMAPIIGALIDRFGVRRVAVVAIFGISLGYFGLTLHGGSIPLYYAGWACLAVLGSGSSPIVWTRAVASWFERSRGLALGITLCGTGLVAVFGPGIIGGIIASYGWRAGFYALSAGPILIALPLVLLLFKARDDVATQGHPAPALTGMTVRQAWASPRYWRLLIAFFMISVTVGGLIVSLQPLLEDRGIPRVDAARAIGMLGFAVIAGRLTVGFLVDRFPARIVGPLYILLPVAGCLLLAEGVAPIPAIALIGLSAGAEVDLLAYLISRYFGMRHYAKIYGWGLSAFSGGAGTGPIVAGWIHDATGSYVAALYLFAVLVIAAAALIASLGRPDPAYLRD